MEAQGIYLEKTRKGDKSRHRKKILKVRGMRERKGKIKTEEQRMKTET